MLELGFGNQSDFDLKIASLGPLLVWFLVEIWSDKSLILRFLGLIFCLAALLPFSLPVFLPFPALLTPITTVSPGPTSSICSPVSIILLLVPLLHLLYSALQPSTSSNLSPAGVTREGWTWSENNNWKGSDQAETFKKGRGEGVELMTLTWH